LRVLAMELWTIVRLSKKKNLRKKDLGSDNDFATILRKYKNPYSLPSVPWQAKILELLWTNCGVSL